MFVLLFFVSPTRAIFAVKKSTRQKSTRATRALAASTVDEAQSPELQARLRSSRKRTVLTDGGSRVLSRTTPLQVMGGGRGQTPNSRDAASESAQRSAVYASGGSGGRLTPPSYSSTRMPLRPSNDEVELDSRFAAVDDNEQRGGGACR